jgi:eukaryotic-like serine/threonine-protein kinase
MIATCPDREILNRHLAESCEFPADVTRHIEECADCQQELETLTDSPLREVGLSDRTPFNDDVEPILRRVMDDLIENGPGDSPEFQLSFEPIPGRPDLLGRFGPYEVVREIGRGGMGVVLEAHDPVLRRPVALKVLAPALANSPRARARVLREARATSAIRHDHILSPYAIEEHDGLPCLVFPLIRGRNLQEKIDADGPVPLKAALRIAAEVAEGLAAAHDKGLIHRDMKPSNVLLEGPTERVRLADFGLVWTADEFDLSRDGTLCGTPRYMAPEQARGEACSTATGLFSLGSIIHTMLTGRPAFGGDSTYAVLRGVVEDDAPPLPVHVPTYVQDLVRRLHAKNPANRPASATEVVAELRAALTDRKEAGRRWKGRVAALVAVTALLVGVVLATTEGLGLGGAPPAPVAKAQPGNPVVPAAPPPAAVPALLIERPLLSAPRPTLFVGHTGSSSGVAVTPDGRFAVSVSGWNGDHTIRVWDFATGKELRKLELETPYPATDAPTSPGLEAEQWIDLSISPDGKQIATGSWGGLAVLWDFTTGKELHRLLQPSRVTRVQFSPDGKTLLSASGDGKLYLWDVASGKLRTSWLAHAERIRVIAFLPDGKRILSGGYDKTVKAWDVDTQKELYRCEGHSAWVQGLAVAKNAEWFLSGADDIRKWDAKTGKLLQNYGAPDMYGVTGLSLSPDDSLVASSAYDWTVRIWGVRTGRELYRFTGQKGWVLDVAFAPDGQNVLCTSGGHSEDKRGFLTVEDYALRRWKVPTSVPAPAVFSSHTGPISALATTPDGKLALSASGLPKGDKKVVAWSMADGKAVRVFQPDADPLPASGAPGEEQGEYVSVAVSPDGKLAFTATSSGAGVLWDIGTGAEVRRFVGHRGGMTAGVFTPDGKQVVTAGGDKSIRIWDMATAKEVKQIPDQVGTVRGIAISGDGTRLIAAGDDNSLTVWDLATGKSTQTWKSPYMAGSHRVALSKDGKLAVSAGEKVVVWDVETGKLVKTLEYFGKDAVSVTLSPDGRRVASGALGGRVYLWDLESGDLLTTLADQKGPVQAVAFSPTGRYLLTAGGGDKPGDDYAVRRFDLLSVDSRAGEK